MFKDKLIFDVPEGPKLGQLKDLEEASDDELVEIGNTAVEVLELRESEEETNLERVDQDKLEVEITRTSTWCSSGSSSTFVEY